MSNARWKRLVAASAASFAAACGATAGSDKVGSGNGGSGGGFIVAVPSANDVSVLQFAPDDQGCLSRPLVADAAGHTFCSIVEVLNDTLCLCDGPGRAPITNTLSKAVRDQLAKPEQCTGSIDPATCSDACVCAIAQESGDGSAACKADPIAAMSDPAVPPGFCYIADPGSPLLAMCKAGRKQTVRFVSHGLRPTPTPGAPLFIACEGQPVPSSP